MKILSIECSATAASAAVTEDKKVLASSFINVKLTHSQTLMPMVKLVLENCLLTIDDIDCIAVAAGPGSFTGIRIGISAVKGLAMPKNIPCCAVSALEAMAHLYSDRNAVICACMDARCNQVYNALFEVKDGEIKRLTEDRALMCSELKEELITLKNNSDLPIIITGDGTDIFLPLVSDISLSPPEHLKYQNAIGVAFAANNKTFINSSELLPVYLRLPQAERELKQKQNNQ